MYRTVLFDLDGTLTDSGLGITNSVAYALKKFGIEPPERSILNKFVDPPLQDSFKDFIGLSEADTMRAIMYYREYYEEKGIYENALYGGIVPLLQALFDDGCQLLVATSKPEKFAIQILDYFDIQKYFTYTAGANMDRTRGTKHEVLTYALETVGVSDKASAVLVGDRKYDILGAAGVGIASIGVLYGYGSREELEAAGAVHIAETVADVYPIIRKGA